MTDTEKASFTSILIQISSSHVLCFCNSCECREQDTPKRTYRAATKPLPSLTRSRADTLRLQTFTRSGVAEQKQHRFSALIEQKADGGAEKSKPLFQVETKERGNDLAF